LKHQIYRGERRKLLSSLYKLRLEQPGSVRDPPQGSPPIPDLPVYRGYRCLAQECGHVCASQKRMSQHWSEAHGERESRNVQAREAWLQTFFRGNKVRYFEVGPPPEPPPLALPTATSASTPAPINTQVAKLARSPHEQLSGDSDSPADSALPLDLEAMRYYHHYLTSDSILPGFDLLQGRGEKSKRWQMVIPLAAHRHQFLMYGLLGLAAFELSHTTADTVEAKKHREASFRYQTASLGDFLSLSTRPEPSNAVALVAYARLINFQRICSIPDREDGFAPFSQTVEMIHLYRGQHEAHLSVQPLLPPDSGFLLSPSDMHFLTDRDDALRQSRLSIPPRITARLENLPAQLYRALTGPSGKPSEEDWDPVAYTSAIELLFPSYEHSFAITSALVATGQWNANLDVPAPDTTAFAFWPRFVPESFIVLLQQGKPAALVVFAHWWWLARGIEFGTWFARLHARNVLTWLAGGLTGELRDLVTRLM
jgi:hypothetical protein